MLIVGLIAGSVDSYEFWKSWFKKTPVQMLLGRDKVRRWSDVLRLLRVSRMIVIGLGRDNASVLCSMKT